MEVQVVSNEMIKPSSPTPDHLRNYTLSFLDQISLRTYNPFIYFYSLSCHIRGGDESNIDITEISQKLKKSLSQALTLYYPLAGRHVDNRVLKCNDDGALFVEARAKAEMSSFLENPEPSELNKLLPLELDEPPKLPLGVQLNVFDCGGIAIGVCVSHQIGDALSSLVFIQSWMDIARGRNDAVVRPEFVSRDLFPSKDLRGYDLPVTIEKNMCNKNVTKRFVFESSNLESLRAKYQERTSQEGTFSAAKRLSRIEALSAFIWARFADATKLVESPITTREFLILHAVNIRPKIDKPLPNHSFGNYYSTSLTNGLLMSNIDEECSYGLARKIGEDIRKVDKGLVEYVRSNADEFVDSLKKETARFLNGEVVRFFFSSLCRFPLYEADFGFGKPTWVSSASRGFNNSVALLDNKKGDGIEAYICLSPQDMERLEADKDFLAFVSPIFAA